MTHRWDARETARASAAALPSASPRGCAGDAGRRRPRPGAACAALAPRSATAPALPATRGSGRPTSRAVTPSGRVPIVTSTIVNASRPNASRFPCRHPRNDRHGSSGPVFLCESVNLDALTPMHRTVPGRTPAVAQPCGPRCPNRRVARRGSVVGTRVDWPPLHQPCPETRLRVPFGC